jgi:chromosome segregation ATPase
MGQLIAWVLFGLTAAAAFSLFLRVRGLRIEGAAARLEADKLRAELVASRDQLTHAAAKHRRIVDESQELRRKLDKAKRRGTHAEGAPGPAVARIPELEAELERARQARDAAREEVDGLASELKRMRAQVSERPALPEVPVPLLDNAAIEALQARARSIETELAAARRAEHEHARAQERLKAKLRTQDDLYVAIRGDLAAKKDRLRTQQEQIERLQALKVAFIDAAPAAADAAIAAAGPLGEGDEPEDSGDSGDGGDRDESNGFEPSNAELT